MRTKSYIPVFVTLLAWIRMLLIVALVLIAGAAFSEPAFKFMNSVNSKPGSYIVPSTAIRANNNGLQNDFLRLH